jgi:hypothetical protein
MVRHLMPTVFRSKHISWFRFPCRESPREAEIVRWIFETYASGTGIQTISRTLEEREIPTRQETLAHREAKYLLQNHTYAGMRYLCGLLAQQMPQVRQQVVLFARRRDFRIATALDVRP